jgi:hypothetical protein
MVARDEFSERYADLLTGSYDCVDRAQRLLPARAQPGRIPCLVAALA